MGVAEQHLKGPLQESLPNANELREMLEDDHETPWSAGAPSPLRSFCGR